MFEILQELPGQDTEIQSEQMLLEKWHQQICSTQGCRKPSICQKMQYLQYLKKKCDKAKFNKTRCARERNVEDLWNVEEVWLWLKSVRCQLGGNRVRGVTFKVGCQNILDMKFPGTQKKLPEGLKFELV